MKQIEEFLLPLDIVEELKGIGFDESLYSLSYL